MKWGHEMRACVLVLLAACSLRAQARPIATPVENCQGAGQYYDYPIVLKGSSALHGVAIDSLTAYARRPDGFERVALQIDEVNARGEFVLDEGLPFTAHTDNGLFDENDELVIDGAQLGLALDECELPSDLTHGTAGLYHLRACQGGQLLGELLLVAHKTQAPKWSKTPQVNFDRGSAVVVSELYRYFFPRDNPVLVGAIHLRRGDREWPLTRSSQFLMPLKTPSWLPDLMFDASDWQSTFESWRTGPVRSIVAVGVKYSAFLSLFRLHLFSELIFYRNRFEVPTPLEFVFDPSRFLTPGSGLVYSLELAAGPAPVVVSNLVRLPEVTPERAIHEALGRSRVDRFFTEAHGTAGSLRIEVATEDRLLARVPPPFLIERSDFQDPQKQRFWPWLNQLKGDLGLFIDFSAIPQGDYEFSLDLVLSSDAYEKFTDYGNIEAELVPLRLCNKRRL